MAVTKLTPDYVNCKIYKIDSNTDLDIKYHVFIPKHGTLELSQLIKKENWGKNNSRLYVYLDYIWRTQLIDNKVKLFKYNNKSRIIFNTGLYSRNDNLLVYLLLEPNNVYCNGVHNQVRQKWRVSLNMGNGKNRSFVTEYDLMYKYKLNCDDIPNKTVFDDVKFKENYAFMFSLDKRMVRRIHDELVLSEDIKYSELKKLIKAAVIKSVNYTRYNPNIISKYLHINPDNSKYITQILIPLALKIDNNYTVYLCLVAQLNDELQLYTGIDIIRRDVGYRIARVFGDINVNWLKGFQFYNKDTHTLSEVDTKLTYNTVTSRIKDEYMLKEFSCHYINDPLMYIATVLPLKLPDLINVS
mmetsp:Transcript_79494/g.97264  ORF Transcript_79494/g.97264 Transcript_79494/m.97264 type:complete len:356 (-) Transcript_79494:64-1131(-)